MIKWFRYRDESESREKLICLEGKDITLHDSDIAIVFTFPGGQTEKARFDTPEKAKEVYEKLCKKMNLYIFDSRQ